MNTPRHKRVAVQLVTYNNERTLRACLTSLRKQTLKDFSVIAVDNNSQDSTKRILAASGIRSVYLSSNTGYAAGHNRALSLAKSDYVLTLNPDVALSPTFLAEMVNAMDHAGKNMGSASGLLYRVETLGEKSRMIDGAGLYMTPARRQMLRFAGQTNVSVGVSRIFGPDGSAAFYRRSMLADIDRGFGVFDEDFFMHKEDVDVCWRAQLRGWKALLVPQATASHIRTFRAGRRSGMPQWLRRIAVRNRYYLMLKNELPLLFLRDVFWILPYDVGIMLYLVLKERRSLSAFADVVRSLPRLFRKRASIMRSRRASTQDMARWFSWRQA
jgi:GT2 family glycosyltransferase